MTLIKDAIVELNVSGGRGKKNNLMQQIYGKVKMQK